MALYYMPLLVAVGGPLLKQRTSSPSCGDIEVRLMLAVTILLVILADAISSPMNPCAVRCRLIVGNLHAYRSFKIVRQPHGV